METSNLVIADEHIQMCAINPDIPSLLYCSFSVHLHSDKKRANLQQQQQAPKKFKHSYP